MFNCDKHLEIKGNHELRNNKDTFLCAKLESEQFLALNYETVIPVIRKVSHDGNKGLVAVLGKVVCIQSIGLTANRIHKSKIYCYIVFQAVECPRFEYNEVELIHRVPTDFIFQLRKIFISPQIQSIFFLKGWGL